MCNKTISVLMPLTFYFSIFLGIWIPNMSPFGFSYPEGYAFSTMQPISRLPLFWTGVFAGILCIRIQNGDLSALDSKSIRHTNKTIKHGNRHLRWLPSWRLMSNRTANFRVVQMSSWLPILVLGRRPCLGDAH